MRKAGAASDSKRQATSKAKVVMPIYAAIALAVLAVSPVQAYALYAAGERNILHENIYGLYEANAKDDTNAADKANAGDSTNAADNANTQDSAFAGDSANPGPGAITPDGEFGDWEGRPSLPDKTGDGLPQYDIVQVKWFPDMASGNLYLYCERLDGAVDKNPARNAADWQFQAELDTAAGKYTASVRYHPESRQVRVDLTDAFGRFLWGGKGKWGDDKYSPNRVEFYVPLSYITDGHEPGGSINMSFLSLTDRAPDSGFITVSAAGTFPWLAAILLFLWIAVLVFLRRRGMHFFMFIAGSAGLFMFAATLLSGVGEKYLETGVAWCLELISQLTGSFGVLAGYSLVTVYRGLQAVSFIIDYECSGFIETLVFISLLSFYPAFGGRARVAWLAAGSLFIFLSNIIRLLFIIYSIRLFGTSVFFLSHTVFARVLFFAMMVLLYYCAFTRPHIGKQKVGDLSYD